MKRETRFCERTRAERPKRSGGQRRTSRDAGQTSEIGRTVLYVLLVQESLLERLLLLGLRFVNFTLVLRVPVLVVPVIGHLALHTLVRVQLPLWHWRFLLRLGLHVLLPNKTGGRRRLRILMGVRQGSCDQDQPQHGVKQSAQQAPQTHLSQNG